MDSPLATSTRVIARRRLTREEPHESWRRIISIVGAVLLHIVFLLVFILGPVDEGRLIPEPKVVALHVRLIDAPEPPPPPPIRGTPPREKGPRHKGQAAAASKQRANASPRSSEPSTMAVAQASPATAPPVVAQTTVTRSPTPKRVAAPKPPVSLPKTAPTPQLQPIPVAGPPPPVVLAVPTMHAPVPPRFQPEPVRAPQAEGNQPMPPPASLALPDVPPQAMPAVDNPTIALTSVAPPANVPPSVAPARAEMPAAPPVPELQAIPLPAQTAATVNLKASMSVAAPAAPRELPQVQAPTVEPTEAQLEAVPVSPTTRPNVASVAPTVKIDVADKASVSAVQTSIPKPDLSLQPLPSVPAPASDQSSSANQAAPSATKADAADKSAAPDSADSKSASTRPDASASQSSNDRDVSTAPNATPQGSDTATPGQINGVANAPDTEGKQGAQPSATQAQGAASAAPSNGKNAGVGRADTGTGPVGTISQAGAEQGAKQGNVGSYVQVIPHGDTTIMDHRAPNIGYKPTRFDKDWTPPGESSVDTALRHAVEKTTTTHTFHLPQGVRIKCALTPLLPMALLSCGNGDPPPPPVADKVYDRMHLAPANPPVPPAPAASAAQVAKVAPLKLDNSAECATARVSGGPPPPGCESIILPVKLAHPASSSSAGSWVPASDQFH
ncbi:hypothetical protein HDE78_001301 [Rhodanobacter sp. K2T2]|uniref:hypothetical protein n=1 Tax=Rhodanobacter sp. K2T2 TaxID=2723085 RepID=UPI0015CD8F2D|nr:hypothetical protein [Rhodanobacter sp. K2T2]NYE28349.1 hypothetical protein [Rhodanobacter sp. K2T2]